MIPTEEVIIIFLLPPSPKFKVDMGKTDTPSVSGLPGVPVLHTGIRAQELEPRTSHTGGQGCCARVSH